MDLVFLCPDGTNVEKRTDLYSLTKSQTQFLEIHMNTRATWTEKIETCCEELVFRTQCTALTYRVDTRSSKDGMIGITNIRFSDSDGVVQSVQVQLNGYNVREYSETKNSIENDNTSAGFRRVTWSQLVGDECIAIPQGFDDVQIKLSAGIESFLPERMTFMFDIVRVSIQ